MRYHAHRDRCRNFNKSALHRNRPFIRHNAKGTISLALAINPTEAQVGPQLHRASSLLLASTVVVEIRGEPARRSDRQESARAGEGEVAIGQVG